MLSPTFLPLFSLEPASALEQNSFCEGPNGFHTAEPNGQFSLLILLDLSQHSTQYVTPLRKKKTKLIQIKCTYNTVRQFKQWFNGFVYSPRRATIIIINFRIFSSLSKETYFSSATPISPPILPALGNHLSTFCFYKLCLFGAFNKSYKYGLLWISCFT